MGGGGGRDCPSDRRSMSRSADTRRRAAELSCPRGRQRPLVRPTAIFFFGTHTHIATATARFDVHCHGFFVCLCWLAGVSALRAHSQLLHVSPLTPSLASLARASPLSPTAGTRNTSASHCCACSNSSRGHSRGTRQCHAAAPHTAGPAPRTRRRHRCRPRVGAASWRRAPAARTAAATARCSRGGPT